MLLIPRVLSDGRLLSVSLAARVLVLFNPCFQPSLRLPYVNLTTIKFTMELEKDGSLPFLDANLTRKEDGTLNISVFRKQTHTDRYLQLNSHHPVSAKRAAVRSLFDRARNITLQEDLQKEEDHLTATFKQNGYPLPFIRSISSMQKPSTPPEDPDDEVPQEKPPLVVIPYVSGVSERIRKA